VKYTIAPGKHRLACLHERDFLTGLQSVG
jgi:hypothetical protein